MSLLTYPWGTFGWVVGVCAVGILLGVWQFRRYWRKSED